MPINRVKSISVVLKIMTKTHENTDEGIRNSDEGKSSQRLRKA